MWNKGMEKYQFKVCVLPSNVFCRGKNSFKSNTYSLASWEYELLFQMVYF